MEPTVPARPIIRVLVSGMPRILYDIFEHAVLHQPDFELVRERSDGDSSAVVPDVVILGATDGASAPLALLARWPGARIMIVTPAEGEAALYELKPHMTALGSVSGAGLVQMIRDVVQGPRPTVTAVG